MSHQPRKGDSSKFVWSPYTKKFETNAGHTVLYHSLLHRVGILEPSKEIDIEKGIEDVPASEKDEIIESPFCVEIGNETDRFKQAKHQLPEIPTITTLFLILTEDCNLDCGYCLIEQNFSGDSEKGFMDLETMRSAVDYFFEIASDPQNISLYGGEPFLQIDLIRRAVEYIRTRDEEIEIKLYTNGTLINPEFAAFLKDHDVIVQISIDGERNQHNKQRVDNSGGGSFERVIEGYESLNEAGVRNTVSVTVGNHNVSHLANIVEFLFEEVGATYVGFDIISSLINDETPGAVDPLIASNNIIDSFERAVEMGEHENHNLAKKVDLFTRGEIELKRCTGYGNQLVIAPNGDVGPCQGFLGTREYFSATVGDSIEKSEDFKMWCELTTMHKDICRGCPAIGICSCCAYDAKASTGDLKAIDETQCIHNRNVLTWMLDKTVEERTGFGINNESIRDQLNHHPSVPSFKARAITGGNR